MTASQPDPELHPLADIDQIIHAPARLMMLTYLYVVESADYVFLTRMTGLTWGNLSTHMSKLEESGYIEMLKELQRLEDAWQERKDSFCLIADRPVSKNKDPRPVRLRTTPLKIAPAEAGKAFRVDDLWRPDGYVQNDFNTDTSGLVLDAATGLAWQQAGSEYPLTWHQAAAYVESLNQQQYTGHRHWRLPTVDELMSLLTETPHGEDFCIAPVFDPCQRALWSCDRRSFTAAWYVSVDMGFVSWQDFSAYYYVRAVSDNESA